MEDELNNVWTSYKTPHDGFSFWQYQFKKHGTCALSGPYTANAKLYFEQALHLSKIYNVGEVIQRAKLLETAEQQQQTVLAVKQVQQAVAKHVGKEPILRCNKDGLLTEVWMCFSKFLKLMPCPPAIAKRACKLTHVHVKATQAQSTSNIWLLVGTLLAVLVWFWKK